MGHRTNYPGILARPDIQDCVTPGRIVKSKKKPVRRKYLKGFIHGSAHARVLRNLICVPAWNKANF